MSKRALNIQIATRGEDKERRVARLKELSKHLGLSGISGLLKGMADLPDEDFEALKAVLKSFFRERG